MNAWQEESCNRLYLPAETFDQFHPDTSSIYSPPTIDDKRTDNGPKAIDRNNGANEPHDGTEGTLATMIYGAPPVQQRQDGLYQDFATPVQIPLEGTASSMINPK
jgi:hypothetical protein